MKASKYTVIAGLLASLFAVNASAAIDICGDASCFRDPSADVVGNGVSIGAGNSLNGSTNGVVVGNNGTLSNSENGVVIGSGSVTDGDGLSIGGGTSTNGGIAIGAGSSASSADEMNIGNRQITGVANGVNDTDAANVGQLNEKANQTLTDANNYTNNKATETFNNSKNYTDESASQTLNKANDNANNIASNATTEVNNYTDNAIKNITVGNLDDAKNYTDKRYYDLNKKLDDNMKTTEGGISGAMAMTGLPQNYGYNTSFGLAVGAFGSEQAMAAGGNWNINDRVVTRINASLDTQGGVGVAAGVGFGIN